MIHKHLLGFKKNLALILLLLIFSTYCFAMNIDYIIDTDIGGDIDDVLALVVAMNNPSKPLAVTTSHIEPEEKARIAKLIVIATGHPDIPVYAGIGIRRDGSNELFKKQNSLWPPMYGYPNPSDNEKKWYEKQSAAYRESYGSLFDAVKIEAESAPEFIVRIAKQYSPNHKLLIIALGPLHNIDAALMLDNSISNNIIIYSMGGTYPKGYNWLISPETSSRVLSQTEVACISNELIDKEQFFISPAEFDIIEKNIHSKIGKAIIADWKNWYKIDQVNKKKTQLGDPVTLYLALHPEEITELSEKEVNFPCVDDDGQLRTEFIGLWYSKPGLENKIITTTGNIKSHIHFVSKVRSAANIKNNILSAFNNFSVTRNY